MAENAKKSSIAKKSSAHLVNIKKPNEVRKRLKLVFQRIPTRLVLQKGNEPVSVSMALIDISETGAGLFTSRMLGKGAAVELSILEPQAMTVKGLVAWCTPMHSGMNLLKFPFRAGVQFSFGTEEERQKFNEYIAKLFSDGSLHWSTKSAEPATTTSPEKPAVTTIEMAAKVPEATEAPKAEDAAPAPAAESAAAESPKAEDTPPAPTAESDDEKKAA